MVTPYDWQEAIGNRAQYIEGRLAQGAPVLAVSLEEGILVFTMRRQARKIYEIYDALIFAGIGQQSDVEAMRLSALEFASREGYNRSEQDVTIQRVSHAMSVSVKQAFGDFSTAPLVAKSLFAEIAPSPADDLFYVIDYDGDYEMRRRQAVLSGPNFDADEVKTQLAALAPDKGAKAHLKAVEALWRKAIGESDVPAEARPEAVLLRRSDARENRFELLFPEEF